MNLTELLVNNESTKTTVYVEPEEFLVRVVLYTLMAISLVIPNTIALVSMSRTRGIPQNIKIPAMNLIICDILSGVSVGVRVALKFLSVKIPPNASCFLQSSWTLTTGFGSMLIISSIAVDRCICLYFENAYITKITTRKIFLVQVIIWGLAIFYSMVVLIDHVPDYQDVRCFNPYIGPFGRSLQLTIGIIFRILAFVSYFCIHMRIKKMIKTDISRGIKARSIFKTTYKLILIGIIFHFMYFPYLCYNTYLATYPDMAQETETLLVITSSFSLFNGCVNPFLYVWRFRECRLEAKKILFFFNKNVTKTENEKKKRILVSFLDMSISSQNGST